MSSIKVMSLLLVLLAHVLLIKAQISDEGSLLQRVKRGSAYAGGYGGGPAPKLSPSVALGTYGGFVGHRQGGGGGKLTVQEALGQYGGFLSGGGHRGPNVHGSGGDIFNKGGHPSK